MKTCYLELLQAFCNHEGRCHQLIEMPEQKAGNTGVIGDISKLALEPLCTQISCGIINMLIVYVAVNLTFHYLQQKKKNLTNERGGGKRGREKCRMILSF